MSTIIATDSARFETAASGENGPSLIQLLDLLLKDRPGLERLLRQPEQQRRIVPRLLTLGLIGFAIYGIGATVMLNAVRVTWGYWPPGIPAAIWSDRSVANLLVAYGVGLVAANGVCLPSFYFYGLLAGVRTTMLAVLAHAMKGMASAAIALVGILPIYVATALTVVVFPVPRSCMTFCVGFGLLLPFVAGLWGVKTLYDGFLELRDTICVERRESRACLLRRLLLAWCGCYTAVTPLMVYVLWNFLAMRL